MSEMLGISEEQLLCMTEDNLLEAVNELLSKAKTELDVLQAVVADKKRQAAALRSENINLRCTSIGLKIGCAVRQVQIGFLRTLRDMKSLLQNR